MSTTLDLKANLIKKIEASSDENLQREAMRLMEIEINEIELPFQLSEEMNLALDEAQHQIKKGAIISHHDAKIEAEKWL